MLAAFGSSPPGNLRMATNEAWLWVTAACLFTSTRILLTSLSVRQCMLGLLVVCGCGLSVHGMHQYFVSLPQNRAEYLRDPEAVLRDAMLDAPPGSAERMVFENRLMDGGPTATFALANSLAAVLLVSVIFAGGILAFCWGKLHPFQRVGWAMIVLLCAGCLMAARSRSATLAMLIASVLLLIAASRVLGRRHRVLGWGLFGVLATGGAGALFLALFGNREWFEEAPTSLAFRFQYWRSTWQMVLDHPLYGAGPGNFQSIYERYRESTATEQIAEPHNLLMETLAASGFIGLALLMLVGLCVLAIAWFRELGDSTERVAEVHEVAPRIDSSAGFLESRSLSRWVWLGAGVAFALVWLLGWISRQPPDLDASLFVVPTFVLVAYLAGSTVGNLSSRDLDIVLAIAMASISIHLMISGGWTVPGVAIVIWLGAGMLARLPGSRVLLGGSGVSLSGRGIAVVAAGLGALLLLWAFSLRPVEQQRIWMARAADAQRRGQLGNANQALQEAVEADPWSAEATLWLADHYRWRLVSDPELPEIRHRWEAALEDSRRRAGEDPAVYRMIGAQQIHLFQKLGRQRDLESASKSFEAALGWSPANQWMFAQMAAIDRAQGDAEAAVRHAEIADSLSRQGGNIERALSRQMVYIPRNLGVAADRGPVRVAADSLLGEPNARPARISDDE